MYKVRLQSFEGPFDLLVYLIETAEMSIYDIKISQITNQYLEYLHFFLNWTLFASHTLMFLSLYHVSNINLILQHHFNCGIRPIRSFL